MSTFWMAVVGFVVGLIARAVLPGTQSLGIVLTALLGVAGSLIASWTGSALGWYQPGEAAGFVASVFGAAVLLALVGLLKRASAGSK